MDSGFKKALQVASKKHDLVALITRDKSEDVLPDLGLIAIKDFETGKTLWLDSSNKTLRRNYSKTRDVKMLETIGVLRKSGVDFTSIYTGESYVKPLMQLFKQRESKR